MSRTLIIDADVLQSAGETEHPRSKRRRDSLNAVLSICHKAGVPPQLSAEWKRHSSDYSRKWRVSMTKRGKLIELPDPPEEMRRALEDDAGLTDDDRSVMGKDLHLVAGALSADHVVLSCDENARGRFSAWSAALPALGLGKIAWRNPASEQDDVLTWLRSGARHEDGSRLGQS